MSYYKHIKTVQAFQLGNIIPIAPRNFGGKGRPLVYQPEDLSQDSNPISITPVGAKKSSKEAAAAKAYIDKIPSYVAPVNRKVTKDFIAKIPSYKDGKEKQALASQAYIDKIPKYVNPVDRQSTKDFIAKIPKYVAPIDRQATKDFINKIPSYVAPVDRQATKDFIAKIPSYVDPANRKAVVDAAKEEIVRKNMPTGSKEKTAAGKLKTEGAGKDSPEVARNKMIQRTLGVKVDGIMGTKSMAALEAMKQTQISLGFTDKDVDGIRGIKTTAAINARDKEVSAQIMALKKPATTDRSMDPIRIARPEQSRQEMRQEKRAYRKAQRELDKAPVEFDYKRNGGIFYCPTK